MNLFTLIVPLIFAFISLYATMKKVDLYSAFIQGAGDGLLVVWRMLPPLIGLLTGISMVRASGMLDLLAQIEIFEKIGLSSELLPLMLIRPLSGAGALSVGAELMETYGPDSTLGRTASVMLGSTETTFYTITVYFGACGITKTRYAIPAALCADLMGFIMAILTVSWFFPEA